MAKTSKKTVKVSEKKKKIVSQISDLIKSKKTTLIASIKNIPASQFQEIAKKLRNKAIVKVPKKNLVFMAIDSLNNEKAKKLKEQIKDSTAILMSDLDTFELARELTKNKTPAKAKAGQEASKDIEIPAGPTDLVPGPAISELGNLGIKIQIEGGKITIKEPKLIVSAGQKISQNAVEVMNKLDIKPFTIGFTPLIAFDSKENKIYSDINIDSEKTIGELKTAYSKSLGFAINIGYSCKDTIKFLISKVASHEKALISLIKNIETSEGETNKSEDIQQENKFDEGEN